MRHLYMALPLVLLLIGTDGWAVDQHKPVTMWDDTGGCNKCKPTNSGGLICTYDECPVEWVGPERVAPKHTPTCEKRMRDAMKAMDKAIYMAITGRDAAAIIGHLLVATHERSQWDSTMEECVR